MIPRFSVVAATLLAFLVLFDDATAQDLPDGGVRLVAEKNAAPDQLTVNLGGGKRGTKSVQAVDHPQIKQSLRVQLTTQPENTWDTSFNTATTGPVKKNDAIVIGFWARGKPAEGTGGGVAEVVFEKNGNPYTKSLQYLVETPDDGSWKQYWIRFRSLEDYEPGGAIVNFQTGYLREEFEMANLQVWNFGANPDYESLPHTPLSYSGREPDAAWRAEAARRIDQHRKAELLVTVVGADGKPRTGVPVSIQQQSHAFDFGTAASVTMITGDGPENERYREVLKQQFNVATIENGLKWQSWDANGAEHHERTLQAVDWLNENGVSVRGHVMVWPGHRYLPGWIKQLESQPEVLTKVIDQHIREVGFATRGKVRDWDVLNEVFDNPELTSILGDEAMTHWFNVARKVAPGVDLYYNDYAGLVRGGHPTTHKDHFEKTIQYLVDNRAPIDGIGIQGHFGSLLTPPSRLLSELDRWGKFGLKIQITEFDVTVPGEKLRAEFTRDFLTSCFSHPAVDGIITWGFWEGSHWKPEAALFDKQWNPTAMGRAWTDLTQNKWRTNETLTTDANGQVKLRGFQGRYKIVADGQSIDANLLQDGVKVKLRPSN